MSEPRWLDDEEMRAWVALVRSHSALMAALDRELEQEHGLSLGDYEVLMNLADAPDGALRMCDLADRVLLSPSALTRRVDRMTRDGLVERRRCEADGRVTYAAVRPEGRALLTRAAPTHVRGVREHLVDRLDRRQLRMLADTLEPIGSSEG